MAGYADTRELIINTLMGRPAGTEIQPEDHQRFALQITDYIRSVELVAGSGVPVEFAEPDTVPVQPDNGQAVYLSYVPRSVTKNFVNFINQSGNSISVTSSSGEVKLVTLLWNGSYWSSQIVTIDVLSDDSSVNASNIGASDYILFSTSSNYSIGDIVRYDGKLYKFTMEHAAGTWIGTDVELASINSILTSKLSELDNKIADLKSVLSEFTTLPVESQTGYYDRYHNTLQPSEAYKSAKINVISGEKYSISTKVNASTSLAMIIEFNGDAMSGYVNAGTSSVQTFSDEIYIVPSGVTSIAVTSYQSEPIIKKEELETSLVSDVKDNASKVETLSVKIEELRKGELTKNLKNVLENGNFASTSKMVVLYATMSAANNILTCVGDGSNATPMLVNAVSVSYTPDKKFALFLRVRVTNDACMRIIIEIAGGNGVLEVAAPIKDKWYDVCVNHLETTYTGNAFAVKFYYADAATANEKTGQIKDAVLFEYSEILGATYPVYKLMNIYKNNVWWNGSKDVIVDNFVSEDVINHSDNGYLLPCPNAYAATKRPIVTFINDDGWADDYTKLVAISQKYNVPFVSALFDGSTIEAWYCLYLQNELGWEMASHPRNTALADLSTEEEIEQAILETNEYLTSRGLKYHNLVYPYGSNDERVRRIAKKYYRCACTTDAGINTGVVGSFNLKRYPLGYGGSDSTNTLENLKAQVDACVANNGWLIFMLHPHMPEHTTALTETIASLIEYIQSIGVEIMTLNDGYNVHGNALECGDYTGGSSGIAIGFDGNMANI